VIGADNSDLGAYLMKMSTGRLSEPQAAVLRALDQQNLKRFRRGFAVSKIGPFYSNRTMRALTRRALVQLQQNGEIAKLTKAGSEQLQLHDKSL